MCLFYVNLDSDMWRATGDSGFYFFLFLRHTVVAHMIISDTYKNDLFCTKL